MNYELAKELKDAGFPQHYPGVCGCDKESACGLHKETGGSRIWEPILSALIEACGEDFRFLDNLINAEPGWKWLAEGYGGRRGRGPTPEEAVARLWLALNKKV